MVQNVVKIFTLGFFISMISGFVLYRSGYFDAAQTSNSLHVSPNGGELHLAQVDQNENETVSPQVDQKKEEVPIMPSSKSITPVFNLEEIDSKKSKKEILPSSKSVVLVDPIEIKHSETVNKSEKERRKAYEQQPELEPKDATDETAVNESQEVTIEGAKKEATSDTNSTIINWRGIWIGVLGILFVAVGSIVYFKRRSK